MKQFSVARSVTPSYRAETAFSMPSVAVKAECTAQSVMGVEVPKIQLINEKRSDGLPYAYAEITSEADYSVAQATVLLPKMLALAETEKSVRMLANEIERNKRRVNALEYVMIPQLEETIKYIKSKLDENERAAVKRRLQNATVVTFLFAQITPELLFVIQTAFNPPQSLFVFEVILFVALVERIEPFFRFGFFHNNQSEQSADD